jgi:hypothetical protein
LILHWRRLLRARVVAAIATAVALSGLIYAVHATNNASSAQSETASFSFAYLAQQQSNRCSLQAAELASMAPTARLQGACCSAMARASYADQINGLRQYRDIAQIPSNPYDISVALAGQLVGYSESIRLTPNQQAIYQRAMQLSPEKGPCCCHCWRWQAFQGLSNYLIARPGWRAQPLGRLIGLLDGCGGTRTSSTMAGSNGTADGT